ncbi:hypothetical protein ABZW18_21180 [Streptomyces sp. NPDC004647]|uniref:hypothetical protein n=1 Tax=Streptomyces sp. NPDC004647 TaxID=3154671 RepID=UPI0033A2AF79
MSPETRACLFAAALLLTTAGISAHRAGQPATVLERPRSFRSCLGFGVPVLTLLSLMFFFDDLPGGLRPQIHP